MPEFNLAEHRAKMQDAHRGKLSHDLDLTNDDDALEFIRRARLEITQALDPWYRRTLVKRAWFSGDQYVRWEKGDKKMGVDPRLYAQDFRAMPLWEDHLGMFVRRQIARIEASNYQFMSAESRTRQLADVESAIPADRVLEHYWERTIEMAGADDWHRALHTFVTDEVIFAYPRYVEDPLGNETFTASEVVSAVREFERQREEGRNGEPRRGFDDGRQAINTWLLESVGVPPEKVTFNDDGSLTVNRGRLVVDWLSGLEVLEDISAERWDEKEFVIVRQRKSIGSLLEQYPRLKNEILKSPEYPASLGTETIRDQWAANRSADIMESTWVDTLWRRPCKKYPKGYFVVAINDLAVAESGKIPYDYQDIPIIPITSNPDSYDFRPRGVSDSAFILQRFINRLLVQIQSNIDKTVDPRILAEEQSVKPDFMVDAQHVDWVKRGTIEWPRPLIQTPLPPHVFALLQHLVAAIKEITGTTNPALGTPDPAARSGRALYALIGSADQGAVVPIKALALGLKKLGERMLQLVAQFVPEETTILIAGERGQREYLTFSGKSLIAQSQNDGRPASLLYDIRVEIKPKPDEATIMEMIDFLTARRFLDPQRDRSAVMRALRTLDISELDTTHQHRTRAEQENAFLWKVSQELQAGTRDTQSARIAMGELVKIEKTQDHGVHLDEHGRLQNLFGEQLHFVVGDYLIQHNEEHMAAEQETMMRQLSNIQAAARTTPLGRSSTKPAVSGVPRQESQVAGG